MIEEGQAGARHWVTFTPREQEPGWGSPLQADGADSSLSGPFVPVLPTHWPRSFPELVCQSHVSCQSEQRAARLARATLERGAKQPPSPLALSHGHTQRHAECTHGSTHTHRRAHTCLCRHAHSSVFVVLVPEQAIPCSSSFPGWPDYGQNKAPLFFF